MSQCDCVNPELPRDTIDLITPVFEAVGGRLYRLHFETKASAIKLTDGMDVETRMGFFERALAGNTTIRFADTIAARNAMGGLVPGDLCYVFDASADKTVPYGGAMYIWLPALSWKKCFNGDSPIDAINMIKDKGGLAVDANGKVFVDFSLMPQDDLKKLIQQIIGQGSGLVTGSDGKLTVNTGGGLATDSSGKLTVNTGSGLTTDANGKLTVNPADLAGAGLVADGTKLKVDFAQMQPGQLQGLISAIVQNGGGLQVDGQGKLYVDYDNMPTEKFENILELFRKGLRLPKYLGGNTNFHVNRNYAAASDNLDEGRGLSAAKPFATIGACAKFVAENYNISNYTANILVSGGDYPEFLTLTDYQRGTGYINIRPASAADTVNLIHNFQAATNTYGVNCVGGRWRLDSIDFHNHLVASDGASAGNKYRYMINCQEGGDLELAGFNIQHDASLALPDNVNAIQYLIHAMGGTITLISKSSLKGRTSQINVIAGSTGSNKSLYGIAGSTGGKVRATGANTSSDDRNVGVSGNFTSFCEMSGCSYTLSGSFSYQLAYVVGLAGAATGKRYEINNGGTCNTGNQGAYYFPGSEDGSVESATFSWYK